jgi:hypothetical protein
MTPGERERIYALVGRQYKALDQRATAAYMRLAYAGACLFCHTTFRSGLDAVDDAFHHVHASASCCRALVHQVEHPAWEAEQARLRRRAESPYARVRHERCERCGEPFLSVRQRRYCRAPICERAGGRARKVRWRDAHPAAGRLELECATCARPFTARRSDARYCGATCRQQARRHSLRERAAGVTFPIAVTRASGIPLSGATVLCLGEGRGW